MARSIMIQGTMSNVGKSLFAAALCRIFHQDGYSAAPFKSQNMALNSYVTSNGLEMGRAQAMQAEAAKIEPSVLMNPILLKPTSDKGSQVILNGEVVGNMRATEYFRRKKEFVPHIMQAYSQLEKSCDIVVIEGAGSPVELNLKSDDIVNMGMAKLARSPVVLVGDIDRGGVFAQLIGTLSLLEDDEQRLVKGLVVNKFRGDRTLFESGVKILEERSSKPVLGVVPFVECDIDAEDSLSDKLENDCAGVIDIAVIKLPKISNFTDFDVFSQYDGVGVRYVSSGAKLGSPDLIIIPGTKNTISDMKWLKECGLDSAVKKCVSNGVPIFGICGGYQIMGKKISDPMNTECGEEIGGLGILDIETVFGEKKTRTCVKGKIHCGEGFFSAADNADFYGYEIHMGQTTCGSGMNFLQLENAVWQGNYHKNAAGSYVHGIFDSKEVSERIVRALFDKKGIEYSGSAIDRNDYKQRQYDILADCVRKNVDMNMIYKILKEGV